MVIVRKILAMLIVVSVASLPITGATALTSDASDQGMAAMSASQSMPDCDGMPCADQNTKRDCASMAACALKCFNFAPIEFFRIALPLTPASVVPPVSEISHTSDAGSAPFRPPRA